MGQGGSRMSWFGFSTMKKKHWYDHGRWQKTMGWWWKMIMKENDENNKKQWGMMKRRRNNDRGWQRTMG